MENNKKFYINGEWVDPISPKTLGVINPANEEIISEKVSKILFGISVIGVSKLEKELSDCLIKFLKS